MNLSYNIQSRVVRGHPYMTPRHAIVCNFFTIKALVIWSHIPRYPPKTVSSFMNDPLWLYVFCKNKAVHMTVLHCKMT